MKDERPDGRDPISACSTRRLQAGLVHLTGAPSRRGLGGAVRSADGEVRPLRPALAVRIVTEYRSAGTGGMLCSQWCRAGPLSR